MYVIDDAIIVTAVAEGGTAMATVAEGVVATTAVAEGIETTTAVADGLAAAATEVEGVGVPLEGTTVAEGINQVVDIKSAIENLSSSTQSISSFDTIEGLTDPQRQYLSELTISDDRWSAMSEAMRNEHIDIVKSRLKEFSYSETNMDITSLERYVETSEGKYLSELKIPEQEWAELSSQDKMSHLECIEDRIGEVNKSFGDKEINQLFEREITETNKISENIKNCPIEGHNGHWEGDRGFSRWVPDAESTPAKNNPDQLNWKSINDKYGIKEGISYSEGEPNFSELAKNTIELDLPETDRSIVFNEADIKAAQQRGCTPKEVRAWRNANGHTWHECRDGVTVQKVPSLVHGNMPHLGGHSVNLNLSNTK